MYINRIVNACKIFKEKIGDLKILNVEVVDNYIAFYYIDEKGYMQTLKVKGE